MSSVLGFPDPVNEKAARVVAGGVAILAVVTLVTGWQWLLVLLALGFLARVLTGPTLSPLGQLATRVVAPRPGPPVLVPGPPKRFAQAIGLTLTTAVAVVSLVLDLPPWPRPCSACSSSSPRSSRSSGSVPAAGCSARLMRLGVIPEADVPRLRRHLASRLTAGGQLALTACSTTSNSSWASSTPVFESASMTR